MKHQKYTIYDVVILINRGRDGINELIQNRKRLKEIHLLLIMELAVEYIGVDHHDALPTACVDSGHADR